jgi:competence ComEA-like helix-hairpin-helix protein
VRERLGRVSREFAALHKAFGKTDTYAHDHGVVNLIAKMSNKALWKWLAEAILVETADTPSRLEWQHMIELNKAGVQDLMNIPGVSAKVAQAIVDYRAKAGQFTSVNELNKVKGIGLKTLRGIKTCRLPLPGEGHHRPLFFNGDND